MPNKIGKTAGKFKPSKPISGILLMMVHAIAISFLYIISKDLNQSLHPFQVAFLYKFSTLVAIIPWCFWGDYKRNLRTKRLSMHIARGVFSLLGIVCFFVAVGGLEVSNAAAITYLEHIFVIMIGVLYFKEKVSQPKLVMIALSVCGALMIVKPGFERFNMYYVYLFLAIIFWSLNCTVIKMLGTTERTKAQLFYMMLFSAIFALPFALKEWKPIEPWHITYIAALAVCYLIHAIAFFKAFKYADISTVMPFDYTRLLFTVIFGYIAFKEIPDEYSMAGFVLIVVGGLYSIFHEARKHRRALSEKQAAQLEAEYEQI